MWLRSLIPLRRFTVETGWPAAEVEREVRSMLRPAGAGDPPAWRGHCSPGGFVVVKRTRRTVVVAKGTLQKTAAGARVAVTLRFPVWVMALIFGGLPAIVFLSLAVTLTAIVRGEGVVPLVLVVPLGMLPGLMRPFWQEAHEVEAFFRRLFPPPPPTPTGPFR